MVNSYSTASFSHAGTMKIRAFATIAALLASGGAMPTAGPLGCKESAADWISGKWDAVVVGAGTAGIIVADRLSEGGKKTLLLELGGSSYGITGGTERPPWLEGTNLSRVDVPGLCMPLSGLDLHTLVY